MSKTALFFSPVGGNVDSVAHQLGALIGTEKVDVIPLGKVKKEDVDKYSQIILIGSTVGTDHWSNEALPDEWPDFFEKMEELNLEDKKFAIVGLGNSFLYPSHFANDMAELYENLEKKDAKIFGFVDAKDYDFTESDAVNEEGFFCGLAIDEDNEPELTPARLEKWIQQLKADFEF